MAFSPGDEGPGNGYDLSGDTAPVGCGFFTTNAFLNQDRDFCLVGLGQVIELGEPSEARIFPIPFRVGNNARGGVMPGPGEVAYVVNAGDFGIGPALESATQRPGGMEHQTLTESQLWIAALTGEGDWLAFLGQGLNQDLAGPAVLDRIDNTLNTIDVVFEPVGSHPGRVIPGPQSRLWAFPDRDGQVVMAWTGRVLWPCGTVTGPWAAGIVDPRGPDLLVGSTEPGRPDVWLDGFGLGAETPQTPAQRAVATSYLSDAFPDGAVMALYAYDIKGGVGWLYGVGIPPDTVGSFRSAMDPDNHMQLVNVTKAPDGYRLIHIWFSPDGPVKTLVDLPADFQPVSLEMRKVGDKVLIALVDASGETLLVSAGVDGSLTFDSFLVPDRPIEVDQVRLGPGGEVVISGHLPAGGGADDDPALVAVAALLRDRQYLPDIGKSGNAAAPRRGDYPMRK